MDEYHCMNCLKEYDWREAPDVCACESAEFTTCRACAAATGDVERQRDTPSPRTLATAERYGKATLFNCIGYCTGRLAPYVNGGYPVLVGDRLLQPGGGVIDVLPGTTAVVIPYVDFDADIQLDELAAWADKIAAQGEVNGYPVAKDPFRPDDVQAAI